MPFKKGQRPWNKNKHLSKSHRDKLRKAKLGKKGIFANNWKGGEMKRNGYIFIYMPNHHRANKRNYVKRVDLVMEQKLKRLLRPQEIVHHKNEDKTDDRPENLKLFYNNNKHMKFHHPKGCLNKSSFKKGHIPWNKGKHMR